METIKASLSNTKNRPIILIVIAVVVLLLCCCLVVVVAVALALRPSGLPVISRDVTPPYYGVFVNQGGSLLELQETEVFDLPTEDQMLDVQEVTDSKPEIIVWRADTNLDYLVLYKLGKFLNEQEEISYKATAKGDGMIQLTPSTALRDGVYCLVQGDPMGVFLPGWCFQFGR